MKKLIAICLILCAVALCFTACMRGKDRAENNGIVTDDTTKRSETTDKSTKDKTTTNKKDTSGILDDASDAVSDVIEGATDAVDDILGGKKDSKN